MQTVNFQCGGCGKLMAVSSEYLGQQVRCPHCQQVVIAPPAQQPAPAPAPEPMPEPFRNLGEHEDIFSTKSETDDALFGTDAPRLEIPRPPEPPPTLSYNGPPTPEPFPADPAPERPVEPTATFNPASTLAEEIAANEVPWSPAPADASGTTTAPAQEPPGFDAPARRREAPRESFVSPTFLLLVFMPVLLWALGATGIGIWLYTQLTSAGQQQDQFDKMLDDGDHPGATKTKGKVRARVQTTKQFVTRPLPDHLKVKLRDTVRVGDLEVTPLKVSRRRVSVFVETYEKPTRLTHDPLVLDLKLKNVAADYWFVPLDNYFDRKYTGIGPVPLTLLVAGKETFYGGPAKWVPLGRSSEKKEFRQWLQGRKNVDHVGVAPGDEIETFVCTDGDNADMALHLFGEDSDGRKRPPYRGPLLWRVQLRRGLVEHRGRKVSATTVIGVEFTDEDIKR